MVNARFHARSLCAVGANRCIMEHRNVCWLGILVFSFSTALACSLYVFSLYGTKFVFPFLPSRFFLPSLHLGVLRVLYSSHNSVSEFDCFPYLLLVPIELCPLFKIVVSVEKLTCKFMKNIDRYIKYWYRLLSIKIMEI